MGARRKGSPSSNSDTSSSSSSDSSSASQTSSSSSPSAARRKQAADKPLPRKRQRSPSPRIKRDRERGHSPRQHDQYAKQGGHRSRRSPSPSRRRRSPAQEPSRSKRHNDERQSSRPSSRRDPDPHSSSRHRAAESHQERSHRDRPERSPGGRHNGRDHDSRRAGKDDVQAKTERNQGVDRAGNDNKRSSCHKDQELQPDSRQDQRDAPSSSRRAPRPDNPGAARDQTGLPPPPSQPLPGPPEGNARRQGPAADGVQRQNRWAKADTQGKEQWGKPDEADGKKGKEEKPEPEANFALSGKLAAESNTVNGVVLVHQEPPESRQPSQMWRLYGFKNGEPIDKPLYIHRQSCYLFGRERRVADVPLDHPSISKQHAILQYRLTEKEGADNMMHSAVRPYLMDLGSANGTYLNNERIEGERYYELLERDMVKFGHSTREYVLLHAQSNA